MTKFLADENIPPAVVEFLRSRELDVTNESIIDQTSPFKISPNPSFSKRGIPPFVKGGKEGFSVLCLYNYGLTSKAGQGSGWPFTDWAFLLSAEIWPSQTAPEA